MRFFYIPAAIVLVVVSFILSLLFSLIVQYFFKNVNIFWFIFSVLVILSFCYSIYLKRDIERFMANHLGPKG
jgi:heme O synthase-like polyprenyltransferase